MRMRKKKNLDARIERAGSRLVGDPRSMKGRWSELSGGRPIWLEIGCGKGRFAVETADIHPEAFIVAAEIEENVLVMAMEAAENRESENLRFIHTDAEAISAYFAPGEVSRIFLNFSDPWPRSPHRRLTAPRFLELYGLILGGNGELLQKTDNRKLFDWSVEQLRDSGWDVTDMTTDLHQSDLDGGVITEYEERFIASGTPINFLRAQPPEGAGEQKVELFEVKTREDVERLAALAEPIWREHFTPLIGMSQVKYMLEKFQSADAMEKQIADGYVYKILIVDGRDAGYMGTHREEERLFLSKLYIDKRFRGRGLSHILLDDCKKQAAGLSAIYLTCNKHNDGSIAVYKKAGFEVIDSVVTDIGGGFVMDDYIFELKLTGRDAR